MKKRLAALTTVATRWPHAAVTAVAVVAALGAALTLFGPFDISTSRRNLLSADDPGQARLLAFFDAFGRPDTAVFVVAGGTPDAEPPDFFNSPSDEDPDAHHPPEEEAGPLLPGLRHQ